MIEISSTDAINVSESTRIGTSSSMEIEPQKDVSMETILSNLPSDEIAQQQKLQLPKDKDAAGLTHDSSDTLGTVSLSCSLSPPTPQRNHVLWSPSIGEDDGSFSRQDEKEEQEDEEGGRTMEDITSFVPILDLIPNDNDDDDDDDDDIMEDNHDASTDSDDESSTEEASATTAAAATTTTAAAAATTTTTKAQSNRTTNSFWLHLVDSSSNQNMDQYDDTSKTEDIDLPSGLDGEYFDREEYFGKYNDYDDASDNDDGDENDNGVGLYFPSTEASNGCGYSADDDDDDDDKHDDHYDDDDDLYNDEYYADCYYGIDSRSSNDSSMYPEYFFDDDDIEGSDNDDDDDDEFDDDQVYGDRQSINWNDADAETETDDIYGDADDNLNNDQFESYNDQDSSNGSNSSTTSNNNNGKVQQQQRRRRRPKRRFIRVRDMYYTDLETIQEEETHNEL